MTNRRTKFQTWIDEFLRTGKEPEKRAPLTFELREDLDALCAAFETVRTWELPRMQAVLPSLCALTTWIRIAQQRVIIHDHVIEPLLDMAQRLVAWPSAEPHAVLASLQVLAAYSNHPGEEILVRLAHKGYAPADDQWIDTLGECDQRVLEELARPLPPERICAHLLTACNGWFNNPQDWPHPFATVEGYKKLAAYLHATDLKDEPAAIEAAKALGFFGKVDRALQSAAASHGSMRVRIEAAYAAAKMEDEDGVNQLGQLSANPAVSNLACKYLEQLEREDAISPLAEEEEFMATADLYEWLGQDEQRGRPPDDVELMDTRQMHWPPLDEERVLWLFRFTYVSPLDQQPQDYVALVGGMGPHSFFRAEMLDWPLDDIYAYHCSWEHFYSDDSDADETKCSIEHGRELIAKGQQEPVEENDDF